MLKKVKINGLDYKIKLVSEMYGDEVGRIDIFEGIIYLENSKPRGMLFTLLHEIIHAILYSAGYTNLDDNEHNEKFIDAITHGLYTVIKDNPELIELIRREEIEEDEAGPAGE